MSYTELIANPVAYADADKRKAMEQLQTLLIGALEARGRVLVKLNVDEANLQRVIDLLPALKSPTVSKLYGEDGYAVETVVAKTDINTLIPALKDAGATGILEMPIAKIVAVTVDARRGQRSSTATSAAAWCAAPTATTTRSTPWQIADGTPHDRGRHRRRVRGHPRPPRPLGSRQHPPR